MRRNYFFGILAALALFGAALAGQAAPKIIPFAVDTIIVPADSPLRFKSFNKDEITASFTGRVTLSGTCIIMELTTRQGDRTFIWFSIRRLEAFFLIGKAVRATARSPSTTKPISCALSFPSRCSKTPRQEERFSDGPYLDHRGELPGDDRLRCAGLFGALRGRRRQSRGGSQCVACWNWLLSHKSSTASPRRFAGRTSN